MPWACLPPSWVDVVCPVTSVLLLLLRIIDRFIALALIAVWLCFFLVRPPVMRLWVMLLDFLLVIGYVFLISCYHLVYLFGNILCVPHSYLQVCSTAADEDH